MNTLYKKSIYQFSVLTAHHEAVELQELILIPSEYNGLIKKTIGTLIDVCLTEKEYLWVLTPHNQTVEHCKNWYLFVFSEYNGSRKQDNRNPNK